MKRLAPYIVLLVMVISLPPAAAADRDAMLTERWTKIVSHSKHLSTPAEQIVYLSEHFLGIPYKADTLGGGAGRTENLVADFDGVDCFTMLDYIEAMRRSGPAMDFRLALIEVRYRNGEISWGSRRHFFTDWIESPDISDVTDRVGGDKALWIEKNLNRRADGENLLAAIPVVKRQIAYLPISALTVETLANLQPGDYIGIYSNQPGLDVSHVGILVERGGDLYLRHASSRRQAPHVVDTPLFDYLEGKAGIIVLRAGEL